MIHTLYEPWFSFGKLFSLQRMKAGTFKKGRTNIVLWHFQSLPLTNLKHASLLLHEFLSQCQIEQARFYGISEFYLGQPQTCKFITATSFSPNVRYYGHASLMLCIGSNAKILTLVQCAKSSFFGGTCPFTYK